MPSAGSRTRGARSARAGLALLLMLFVPLAFSQPDSVRAELGSATIGIDETVTLSVTARDADGDIDTTELETVFDVASRSQSRQVSIINGERSDITTWALELVPREIGIFTVPAVKVGSAQSQLLTLTVDKAPTGAARQVFVETSIGKASPWVQEQIILTLKVFQSVDVLDGSLDEPRGEGLMIVPLEDQRVSAEIRDGVEFRVTEMSFAVFAQQSGATAIEPVTLVASIPADAGRASSYLSQTRRLTRRSEKLPLDVRPRPADAAGQWWLPAQDVTLGENWTNDLPSGSSSGASPNDGPDDEAAKVRVGEPVMRTVTLSGNGVIDTQLPDLQVPEVDGLRIYEDAAELDQEVGEAGVRSRQRTTWSIMPEREGTVTLPAIRVHWFDTTSGTEELATLPARTITVLPATADGRDGGNGIADAPAGQTGTGAAGGPVENSVDDPASEFSGEPLGKSGNESMGESTGESVSESAGSVETSANDAASPAEVARSGWQRWAIALPLTMALACSSGLLLWRARRGLPARSRIVEYPEASTRLRLATSCRDGDVGVIADAVMKWAEEVWPADPPRSLTGIAERLPDGGGPDDSDGDDDSVSHCRSALAHLDAARYSSRAVSNMSAPTSLEALPQQLESAWRLMRTRSMPRHRDEYHLPAL